MDFHCRDFSYSISSWKTFGIRVLMTVNRQKENENTNSNIKVFTFSINFSSVEKHNIPSTVSYKNCYKNVHYKKEL
jgi:hypothetical protein